MAGRFRDYDPHQQYLLPPSLQEWLPDGHLSHFVLDFVSDLDLTAITSTYGASGAPAHSPRMMVGVWLYAYCQGVRSSRRVEKALYEDVGFRVVSGNQQPDHWCLNAFRTKHQAALAAIFKQTVTVAVKMKFVKLGHVAVDGTKIKANASKHKAMSYKRMKEQEAELAKKIADYFSEAAQQDAADDERYGKDRRGDELPEELKHADKRLEAIRKAKKELEDEAKERARAEQQQRREQAECEGREYTPRTDPENAQPTPKSQKNFTDADSRIMRSPDKAFIQAYNGQLAVDSASHIIVAAQLSNQAADCRHLPGIVEDVVTNTGRKPKQVSADCGYYSRENLEFLAAQGVDALIPPDRIRHSAWRAQTPPRGRIPAGLTPAEQMRRKLRTKKGREGYKKRQATVEPVFGHIKSSRGLRQFLHRGIEKVANLWAFDCAAHNLLRIFRLLST